MALPYQNFTYWELLLATSFDDVFQVYYTIVSWICTFLSLLCFPFYVYVYRVNREKDKESLVFPITDSFYKLMIFTFIFFIIEQIEWFLWMYFTYKKESSNQEYVLGFLPVLKTFGFFQVLGIALDSFSIRITQMFHVMLSILAIQKFILYFFESTRKYIELGQKKMKIGLFIFYSAFFIKAFIRAMYMVACRLHMPFCMTLLPKRILYYVVFDDFIIHIPMYSYLLYHHYNIPHDLTYFGQLDWVTAPITMQVSYLGCNKKNLEVIFVYLRKKFGRVASVEPSRIERTTAALQEN
ncbi:hypothetical protein CAEBREN_20691 [Caenorhabditis brenneri]|uniref:Uncharacterized protein n=1 Tax=Caenorhabditis brenneri TaxID=135651 RepID=G0NQA3_CAEBE|nr:hypothetical protein CAEBREN_20691 [Caenorhabditis brenneri]